MNTDLNNKIAKLLQRSLFIRNSVDYPSVAQLLKLLKKFDSSDLPPDDAKSFGEALEIIRESYKYRGGDRNIALAQEALRKIWKSIETDDLPTNHFEIFLATDSAAGETHLRPYILVSKTSDKSSFAAISCTTRPPTSGRYLLISLESPGFNATGFQVPTYALLDNFKTIASSALVKRVGILKHGLAQALRASLIEMGNTSNVEEANQIAENVVNDFSADEKLILGQRQGTCPELQAAVSRLPKKIVHLGLQCHLCFARWGIGVMDESEEPIRNSQIDQLRKYSCHAALWIIQKGSWPHLEVAGVNKAKLNRALMELALDLGDKRALNEIEITCQIVRSNAEKIVEEKPRFAAPVDFVFITALEEERDAVLSKLPGYHRVPPDEQDVRVYFASELSTVFSDGTSTNYKIIVAPLLNMGRVEAANATSDAIRRWLPKRVVVVGIAGGIEDVGVNLGDILISDQVVDYELQKLTSIGREPRYSVHRVDPTLLGAAKNLLNKNWERLISVKRPNRGSPKHKIGPIATGDKIIAFEDVLKQCRADWPKLIGVEMEAGGAASACFQAANAPAFFMIRSVSDFADNQKDSATVEAWRLYVCDVAAAYAIGLLMSGPVVGIQRSGPKATTETTNGDKVDKESSKNTSTSETERTVESSLTRFFAILRESHEKYKPLKYIWGVVGILAVLSIYTLLPLSPSVAIAGFVLLLIAMSLMAIFASAVSNTKSDFLKRLGNILLIITILIFLSVVAIPFSSIWFDHPIPRKVFFKWINLPIDGPAPIDGPKDVRKEAVDNHKVDQVESAKLVLATIDFETTGDNKDDDTYLDIYFYGPDNKLVAQNANIRGEFEKPQHHLLNLRAPPTEQKELASYPYDLNVSQVPLCKLVINIRPNGHDTWEFRYVLSFKFDNGNPMLFSSGNQSLSEGNPKLEIRVNEIK